MERLDYCKRWIGTAISFALFGIGGLLQGLLIHPLVWVVYRDERRRRQVSRRVVSSSMRLFIWLMRTLGVLDYEISGREHIHAHEPCLILANHPSLIDVIFLLALFPDANCVVKAAMARNPLFYALIRSAGYISNEDPVAMICRAVDCLQAGENLIMFPEGTRTVSDSEPRFSNGAAAVAVRAGCACLPIFIGCEPTTLTRQDRWYRIPPRKVRFVAAIQPALELGTAAQQLRDQRAATAAASARLQAYFVAGLAAR